MDVKEAIDKRRSVRAFSEEEVPRKDMEEIIDAGRLAPSGSNTEPLKVAVVESKEARKELEREGAFSQGFVHTAPLILVIAGDPNDYEKESRPELKGKGKQRCIRDLSIASGFMSLRATELGYSSIWIGLIDENVIKGVLDLDKGLMIPYVLCIGKPAEEPNPRSRKSLDETIISKY
jgi:nitroreductase